MIPARFALFRSNHRFRKIVGAVAVASLLAAAITVGVAIDGNLASQIRQSTERVPAPYTELYFSAPSQVPLAPVAGRDVAVTFSVVAHEVTSQVFTTGLVTEQLGPGKPVALARLRVAIGPSRHSYLFRFRAPPPGSRFRLEVSLPASRLSIYMLGRTQV
jgi:hypothetical protein